MRIALWILLGMVVMFAILKIISKVPGDSDRTTNYFKALCDTGEAHNLMKTNEFRELVKTQEFINLAGSLAEEQLTAMAKALTGIVINK